MILYRVFMLLYIYIYIYIQRERERERGNRLYQLFLTDNFNLKENLYSLKPFQAQILTANVNANSKGIEITYIYIYIYIQLEKVFYHGFRIQDRKLSPQMLG